jgi:PAS domain S-box-containing protein
MNGRQSVEQRFRGALGALRAFIRPSALHSASPVASSGQTNNPLSWSLFEALPDAALLWRRQPDDSIILACANRAAFAMSHGKINEYLSSTVEAFFSEHPAAAQRIRDVMDSGITQRAELFSHLRTTGEDSWLSADYVRIDQEHVFNVIRDISERKRIEEERREVESKLRSVMEQSPDGILLVDHAANIVDWNQSLERISGLSPEQLQGMTLRGFHLALQPNSGQSLVTEQAVQSMLDEFNATGQAICADCPRERTITRSDGTQIVIETRLFPIRGVRGVAAGCLCRDVTERKRAGEERERLISELQQSLAQVRTLKGLLPICSACKRIRTDEGYWEAVEVYIRDHTAVEFTHSLCPECIKKLYPDMLDVLDAP